MPIDSSAVKKTSVAALLWDMDGTLVDTEPLWVECEADLMRGFGYEWGEADAMHCIGGPMERVERYLKEKSGSDLDASWFGNQLVEMMLARLASTSGEILRPGALSLVEEAKTLGLKLALVSASRRPIVDAVLSSLPFTFDLSISASEVSRSKPDPEGYVKASELLGAAIHSCVVIEDSSVGIQSGLASGALVVGVTEMEFDHHNFHGVLDLRDLPLPRLMDLHHAWLSQRMLPGRMAGRM